MAYSLAQAAAAVGRNRSTILRAIKIGKLSADRDDATGVWAIHPAELHRIYPVADAHADQHGGQHADAPSRNGDATAELRELRGRIAEKDALIAAHERNVADLRRRLDAEAEERRTAQAKLTALLTDRTSPKSDQGANSPLAPTSPAAARLAWWPWRRG